MAPTQPNQAFTATSDVGTGSNSAAQQPTIGRIVHYVLPSGPRKGEVRPAIITRVWSKIEDERSPGMSNLSVFQDQSDDFGDHEYRARMAGSVYYNESGDPGTWHWPPR